MFGRVGSESPGEEEKEERPPAIKPRGLTEKRGDHSVGRKAREIRQQMRGELL